MLDIIHNCLMLLTNWQSQASALVFVELNGLATEKEATNAKSEGGDMTLS